MDKLEPMVQNIRTLGLPTLISFNTVAKVGGISAAAQQLGMAKSGVSRHIAQLETHLGVKLLERGARSVKLTPVGERLERRIASVLAEIDLIEDIAREESLGVSGQVNLASTYEFGRLVATKLFPLARQRHPDLTLVLRPDYDFADMQDPGIDIAFRVGSVHDDRLIARKMGSFPRILVASRDMAASHPLTHPGDLETAPCLNLRGDRPGAIWEFKSDGVYLPVAVSGPIAVHSFQILLDLVKQGLGFATIPAFMLGDALDSGALIECLPEYPVKPQNVFLVYRPGARKVARIDAVLTLAEDVIPPLLSQTAD